jgi:hypothetical protein
VACYSLIGYSLIVFLENTNCSSPMGQNRTIGLNTLMAGDLLYKEEYKGWMEQMIVEKWADRELH